MLPTLAPVPFGTEIKSTTLDDDFVKEMARISPEHRIWAKMMVDACTQEDSNHDTMDVVTNLYKSKAASKGCNPCHAASKGFRDAWPSSLGPFVEPSRAGKHHEHEQEKVREFFYQNSTPACPTAIKETGDDVP